MGLKVITVAEMFDKRHVIHYHYTTQTAVELEIQEGETPGLGVTQDLTKITW